MCKHPALMAKSWIYKKFCMIGSGTSSLLVLFILNVQVLLWKLKKSDTKARKEKEKNFSARVQTHVTSCQSPLAQQLHSVPHFTINNLDSFLDSSITECSWNGRNHTAKIKTEFICANICVANVIDRASMCTYLLAYLHLHSMPGHPRWKTVKGFIYSKHTT